jgi:hypothetical protein
MQKTQRELRSYTKRNAHKALRYTKNNTAQRARRIQNEKRTTGIPAVRSCVLNRNLFPDDKSFS